MFVPSPLACARCRQPLTEGSHFCVACGHTNEAALEERAIGVVGQANERIAWAQWRRNLFRALGGLFHWLR